MLMLNIKNLMTYYGKENNMRMKTLYEWDLETWEGDQVEDHNHSDKIFRLPNKNEKLVLVRDVGNDISGVVHRVWAYVENGVLPEYFYDCGDGDQKTTIKVPKRFHQELKRFVKKEGDGKEGLKMKDIEIKHAIQAIDHIRDAIIALAPCKKLGGTKRELDRLLVVIDNRIEDIKERE